MNKEEGQRKSELNPMLTAAEVAKLFRVSERSVYRMVINGSIPGLRIGRAWRFPAGPIRKMLDGGKA